MDSNFLEGLIERPDVLASYGIGSIPQRKGVGTRGVDISLISNLFDVKTSLTSVNQYSVDISQEHDGATKQLKKKYKCNQTKVNHAVINMVFSQKDNLKNLVPGYDGMSTLYLSQRLQEDEVESKVLTENGLHFLVRFRFTKELPLSPMTAEVIQALDIIIRSGAVMCNVPVGRSFFSRPKTTDMSLGGGREIWFGYYCSIRPGQWKPLLNVNLCATIFHESLPLIEYTSKYLNKRIDRNSPPLTDSERQMLQKELAGVKVEVTHLPYKRQYKVTKISRLPAKECTFDMNGRTVSVVEYFQTQYKINLKYPNLQCVITGKNSYIPMEVCKTIEGQHARLVRPNHTAHLIRKTGMSPSERLNNINNFVSQIIHQDAKTQLEAFGLGIDAKAVTVKGRVLPAPKLSLFSNQTVTQNDGYWRLNRQQFRKGVTLDTWAIADLGNPARKNEFLQKLCSIGNGLGMKISKPSYIHTYPVNVTSDFMLRDVKANCPQAMITLVILGRESCYEEIKQLSENVEDTLMLTQLVKAENIDTKMNDNFMINILLQMNAKLGGINNGIDKAFLPPLMRTPFIVFGADVCHSASGVDNMPSIAAVVGSLDPTPYQYHTVTTFQRSTSCNTLEYIANLKDMVKECLLAFYRKNKMKPMHILFYRDGVSEGQFEAVRAIEIYQVRLACQELEENYKPPLTFMVVQKRHHVRLFPTSTTPNVGKSGNIPPGSIVEQTITHPVNFDFYLCSHAGIKGTSRPSHYQVLHDDADLSADVLQAVTYNLCHLYGACARSISVPAPVQYAHLAAARAKDHIKAAVNTSAEHSSGSSGIFEDTLNMDDYKTVSDVDERMRDLLYYI